MKHVKQDLRSDGQGSVPDTGTERHMRRPYHQPTVDLIEIGRITQVGSNQPNDSSSPGQS